MRRVRSRESERAPRAATAGPRAAGVAGVALGAVLAIGCEEPPPPEKKPREARVIVKLSFDETVYVDAATPPRKLIERLRHQTKSIFPSLQRAEITVAARK